MEDNNNLNEANNETNKENQINNEVTKESVEFKPVIQESVNNDSFKSATVNPVTSNSSSKKKQQNKSDNGNGFVKTVLLPFTCGILGAGIVVGTCFGIPSVRNNLIAGFTSTTDEGKVINPNTQQISLLDYSETAIGVANKVLPSIVGINVTYSVNSIFYGGQGTATAQGSGVIISEDGYILTNNHVVNSSSSSSYYELGKASEITVTLYNDDTEYEAEIIGTDEQTDLAVIKINKDGLTAAELGDSDSVQVGEFCMAIGNNLGLGTTVTDGIISAVNRTVTDEDDNSYVAIQTNAAINSGNSGGALVNSQGQVIGINTLKISGEGVEGVGFAIPINSTKDIYSQLIEFNKVKRPYLGIGGIDVDENMAREYNLTVGVYVKTLENFGAAERAGIKVGDVITKVDGQDIKNMDELNEIKNQKEIGDKITLTIWRNGETSDIEVTLQEQP